MVIVRIIARKTLRDFVESLRGGKAQKSVKSALDAWFHEVQSANWKTPADVTRSYANASIVGDDRVVFNVKGNDYRLVARVRYQAGVLVVRFFGTNAEYDTIDAETV